MIFWKVVLKMFFFFFWYKKVTLNGWNSDSQPGFRWTLGCRSQIFLTWHLFAGKLYLGVPPNCFQPRKGRANQKRLRTTGLEHRYPMNANEHNQFEFIVSQQKKGEIWRIQFHIFLLFLFIVYFIIICSIR